MTLPPRGDSDSLDQAFARFRATGDPAALGSVFDGTAPELLRLASHLISDLSLAEDLVQTTFLAAIQSCQDYDPRKPVLPWLVGILTNRAHLLRRSRGREPDPDRLEPAPGPDPEKAAETKELTKAVTDAIAKMPEPYRPVLRMHLRHGFSAQEIALTLGRAPGTVRKQLSRGLDLLRRALPAGFAATASCTVLTTQGLSAMREAVLGAAAKWSGPVSATTAVVAPFAIGGVLLMKKAVLMTMAVVAAACVGYLVWPDAAAGDAAPKHRGTSRQASAAAGEVEANQSAEEVAGLSNRQPLADPVDTAASRLTVLEGRCVSETGLPLSECHVRLGANARSSEDLEEYVLKHGDVHWEELEPQVTGKDGRFSFRFAPPPPYQFVVSIWKEGLVTKVGMWKGFEPGATKDLGDIELGKGAIVSGRILDAEGTPVPNKRIGFRLENHQYRTGMVRAETSADLRSGPDGLFVTRTPLAFGTWRSTKTDRYGRQQVTPREFTVSAEQDRLQIDFVLSGLPPVTDHLSGQVVDESGLPVPGVEVGGVNHYGVANTDYIETGKEGRFRVGRMRGMPTDPIRLRVTGRAIETLVTKEKHPWGTKDIQLVVRRGLPVDLVVKDGETGNPIEEFGVRCFRDPDAKDFDGCPSPDFSVRKLGNHPGGRLVLENVPRGRKVLLVEPRGDEYLPSGLHRFTVTEGGAATQVISLYRSTQRRLRVVGEEEFPIAGARVELLQPISSTPVDLRTRTFARSRLRSLGERNRALSVCSGCTDVNGEFMLTGRPREKFALRVMSPGYRSIVINGVVLDPDLGVLRVEVPRGATLVGHLSPPEVIQQFRLPLENTRRLGKGARRYLPHIGLRRIGAQTDWFPPDTVGHAVVADDGCFELAGVPSGDWELHLRFWVASGPNSYGSASEPLMTVRGLEDGKKRELNVDVGSLAAGRLEGKIYVNGEATAGTIFSLFGSKPDGKGGTRPGTSLQNQKTDEGGCFRLQVHPASYKLWVFLPAERFGRHVYLRCMEPLVVAPGQVVNHVFQLHHRPLRLTALAPDGKTPLEGIEIEACLHADEDWSLRLPRTDSKGTTVENRMSCGLYDLRVWPKHLSATEARNRLRKQDPAALERASIQVGTLRLIPGGGEFRHHVILPPSSGY